MRASGGPDPGRDPERPARSASARQRNYELRRPFTRPDGACVPRVCSRNDAVERLLRLWTTQVPGRRGARGVRRALHRSSINSVEHHLAPVVARARRLQRAFTACASSRSTRSRGRDALLSSSGGADVTSVARAALVGVGATGRDVEMRAIRRALDRDRLISADRTVVPEQRLHADSRRRGAAPRPVRARPATERAPRRRADNRRAEGRLQRGASRFDSPAR